MIEQLLAPSSRSIPATAVAATEPVPISRQVTQGTQMVAEDVSPWQLSRLLSRHTLQQSALQYVYGADANQQLASNAKGKKRALPLDAGEPAIVSKRKPRSCVRCRHADCDGRFLGRPCSYVQGVSKLTCHFPTHIKLTPKQSSTSASSSTIQRNLFETFGTRHSRK
jgi:hypothetical protein